MTSEVDRAAEPSVLRVLVVEDELLIRMLIEDMLQELGHVMAAEAARFEEAMQAAATAEFDLAILDGNLEGNPTGPVADVLARRGTPFVFVTGYDPQGLPAAHRHRPVLKKPFQREGLDRILRAALKPN
jgi:CheY-like chemotaxis protein